MERDQILERLADPKTPFLDKFRYAVFLDLDLWEHRDPPNLGENELKRLINYIPANVQPMWMPRDSSKGKHGETGEDEVFKFEFTVRIMGFEIIYFLKGYFFDKGNCHGVCIQSFREVKREKINKLKLVRMK